MQISIAQSLIGGVPVEGGDIKAAKPANKDAFSALFSLLEQEETKTDSESEPESVEQSDAENPDELPLIAEVKIQLTQTTKTAIGAGDKRHIIPKEANAVEVMQISAKPPAVTSSATQEFVSLKQIAQPEIALKTIPSVVNNPEIFEGVEAKTDKINVLQMPPKEVATELLRGSKGAEFGLQKPQKASNVRHSNIPINSDSQISRMAESHANSFEMQKLNLQQDSSSLAVEKRTIVPNPVEQNNATNQLPTPSTVATSQVEAIGTDESIKDFNPMPEMSESDLAHVNLNVGSNSAAYTASEAARAGTVRYAGTQMVDAIIRQPGQPVEVALNPEELGRVRIALTNLDTGLSVAIMAERPETLELMRRHIEQLESEFRQLGYENIGFEFSGGDAQTSGQSESNSQLTSDQTTDIVEPTNPSTMPAQTTGVDIRL